MGAAIEADEKPAKPKKAASRLTALLVNSAKTAPGLYSDGGNGLYLNVRASGSRAWAFRYRHRGTGKLREMGFGTAGPNGVPLQDARDRAAALKADLRTGIDPLDAKRAVPTVEAPVAKKTFGVFALQDWLPAYAKGFKNERTEGEVRRILVNHGSSLFPLALDAITKTEVLAVLTPIWSTKPKTARELRAKIETILQAATPDHRQGENPARWRGGLENNFGRDSKAKRRLRVRHHPAVPYVQLPAAVQALRAKHLDADTNVNLALEFLILTAARTVEVRLMAPTEVDLKNKIWIVPAERMKQSEPHTVPLSSRAIEILTAVLKPNRPFVFEGLQQEGDDEVKPMGHNAMAHALKAVAPGYTPHGLRSTFRDWAGDETEFAREVIEHCLSHTLGDDSERAYRRGRAIERRRLVMTAWADFIDGRNPSVSRTT